MRKKLTTLLVALMLALVTTSVSYAYAVYYDERDWDDDEDDYYDDDSWVDKDYEYDDDYPIKYDHRSDGTYVTVNGEVGSGWYKNAEYEMSYVTAFEDSTIPVSTWIYALPGTGGKLLDSCLVMDNGYVYYLGWSGSTKFDVLYDFCELYNEQYPNQIYNVQTNTFETLPYSLIDNYHSLYIPYSGCVTIGDFLYKLSGQQYADWEAANKDWIDSLGKGSTLTTAEEESLYSIAAMYIPQAMANSVYSGYYYEVNKRNYIQEGLYGGHTVAFEIYIPDKHQYSNLTITLLSDGSYHDSYIK